MLSAYEPQNTYTAVSITKGLTYRFKYRAMNINGWSNWSPIGYITAATVPEPPQAPAFVSATASTITLTINPTVENGGSLVTSYELYYDQGSLSNAYTKITTYDGTSTSYTVPGLTSGTQYRFVTIAVNGIGSSSESPEVRFAAATAPNTPANLIKDSSSTATSLKVNWGVEPDTET